MLYLLFHSQNSYRESPKEFQFQKDWPNQIISYCLVHLLLGEVLGGGHSQNRGLAQCRAKAAPYSENTFPKGFTMHKAQLLNILNLKSSSAERNFHGYKVPSEYTENDSSALHLVTRSLRSKINVTNLVGCSQCQSTSNSNCQYLQKLTLQD